MSERLSLRPRAALETLLLLPVMHVLEAGCGPGALARAMAPVMCLASTDLNTPPRRQSPDRMKRLRQIEGRHGDATLKSGLAEAMAEGALRHLPLEPLASMLSAMFERAALDVASGMDPTVVLDVVRQVILGLAADPAAHRDP